MKFTKELIDDYADKLLIGLTEEENKMVLEEFEVIDQTINMINKIDNIKDVEVMSYCLDDFCCYLRKDEAEKSVPVDELLANCKTKEENEVIVPRVVS